LENEIVLEEESDDYQRGYMNALSAQQYQYSLRNRDVPVNPIQKRKEAAASKMILLMCRKREKRQLILVAANQHQQVKDQISPMC